MTGVLNTGKFALEFHSDSLHEYETPPIYTSLFCIHTPRVNGIADDTLFIDTRYAYDRLS